MTFGTHMSVTMPGQVRWDSGTLDGKGWVMLLPGIPVVRSQGGASGRPGLRSISAIHQLCDFVTSLSLCFLILKNGEVVREPTSKNWHEDVERLARGLSFSVALITMPAVSFQPCQSPPPGLPAVLATP